MWILGISQMWNAKLRAQEGASGVDLHSQVEAFGICLIQWRFVNGRSIVDQNVNAAKLLDALLNCLLHALLVSDVALNWQTFTTCFSYLLSCRVDRAFQLRVRFDGFGNDGNVCSVFSRSHSHSKANAARSSRYENGLTLKIANILKLECLDVFKDPSSLLCTKLAIELFESIHV